MKFQDRLAKVPSSNRRYGGLDDGHNHLTGLDNGKAKRFDSSFYASVEVVHPGLFVIHCNDDLNDGYHRRWWFAIQCPTSF